MKQPDIDVRVDIRHNGAFYLQKCFMVRAAYLLVRVVSRC